MNPNKIIGNFISNLLGGILGGLNRATNNWLDDRAASRVYEKMGALSNKTYTSSESSLDNLLDDTNEELTLKLRVEQVYQNEVDRGDYLSASQIEAKARKTWGASPKDKGFLWAQKIEDERRHLEEPGKDDIYMVK